MTLQITEEWSIYYGMEEDGHKTWMLCHHHKENSWGPGLYKLNGECFQCDTVAPTDIMDCALLLSMGKLYKGPMIS